MLRTIECKNQIMKKIFVSTLIIACTVTASFSQNYLTRNGNISFSSHTALEDVKAQNNEVVSTINSSAGDVEFRVAVKSFHFAKTAMEEHFNDDDYMASEKFPKAGFKGTINNISAVNFSKDGEYSVEVSGNLTIKDVTKPVTASGKITIKNGSVHVESSFSIQRKDYNVIGESFVQKKIGETIQITINCDYDKM